MVQFCSRWRPQNSNWSIRESEEWAAVQCFCLATDMDHVIENLSRFSNVVATPAFTLKPEQEVAVRAPLDGKDVLAVLPTG